MWQLHGNSQFNLKWKYYYYYYMLLQTFMAVSYTKRKMFYGMTASVPIQFYMHCKWIGTWSSKSLTFCLTSHFVFQGKKKVRRVLNSMRVVKWVLFWVNYPFKSNVRLAQRKAALYQLSSSVINTLLIVTVGSTAQIPVIWILQR